MCGGISRPGRLEPLLEAVRRDAPVMPIVAEMNAYRVRYLDEIRDLLLDAWPARGAAGARLRRADRPRARVPHLAVARPPSRVPNQRGGSADAHLFPRCRVNRRHTEGPT